MAAVGWRDGGPANQRGGARSGCRWAGSGGGCSGDTVLGAALAGMACHAVLRRVPAEAKRRRPRRRALDGQPHIRQPHGSAPNAP